MDWSSVAVGALFGGAATLLATYVALRRRVVRLRAAEARAQRQERLAELGAMPTPDTPAAFATLLQAERRQWSEAVRAAGIRVS